MKSRLAYFRVREVWLRLLAVLFLTVVVGVAAGTGHFQSAENDLRLAAFNLSERPASGQVHVIEMDATSVEAIKRWPWPRAHYARIVEQLDAAGVRSIAFDVDFSSRSNPADDQRFADALAGASAPVILPTFAQSASFRQGRSLDSLPIAPLRAQAQLASVSIAPDPDGFIRRMPMATVTSDVPRPSLAAFLAHDAGAAGESFLIDYAFAAQSIPRHSFIAIERGEFDPADLRGKDVLIGATAIEMGDRYPVPRYGVIPGVIVQALASETLLRGQPGYGSWTLPVTLAALLAMLILGARTYPSTVGLTVITSALLMVGAYYSYQSFMMWFEIVPALALVMLAGGGRAIWIARRDFHQARQTDRETGLPNGIALRGLIAQGNGGYVVAAAMQDIDVLKAVLGSGDFALLIRRVAERVQASTGSDHICRTDGRVLTWLSPLPIDELDELVNGLGAIMRSPVEISGRRVDVTLTFGVADAAGARVIENATHAANEAHRAGATWRLFESSSEQLLERQISLMGELEEAIRERQIKVYYQPKLDLKTNRITCTEALVRWEHPVKGMLPPDSFIPLAEETGRIDDLTLHVIRQTIDDMRRWSAQGMVLGAAVNVSARLLSSASFVDKAVSLIDHMEVPTDWLTFEVTESAELEDAAASVASLQRFCKRGIRISMDDYGTGQSTLSYLKTLPLSELKIDRSFVQFAHTDRNDAMLVRSTVHLAHELGLQVVAEGIEEPACLEFLRAIECDYAQGYFIGRPMPVQDLMGLVGEPQRAAA